MSYYTLTTRPVRDTKPNKTAVNQTAVFAHITNNDMYKEQG